MDGSGCRLFAEHAETRRGRITSGARTRCVRFGTHTARGVRRSTSALLHLERLIACQLGARRIPRRHSFVVDQALPFRACPVGQEQDRHLCSTGERKMSATDTTVTDELLNQWATDPNGPVALHLKQKLLPVEGKGGVIFPPTYADIGYNIDTLSDGTKGATIDSVGSQANRMEPLFKSTSKDDNGEELNPLAALVPQVQIILNPVPDDKKKLAKGLASLEEDDEKKKEKVKELEKKEVEELRKLWIESTLFDERRQSLLDLAHRSADAVVKATPELRKLIDPAFVALSRHGNAGPLCAVAPTSLLFGVWDSRDGTGEKRPRLVRSVIRAWDVDVLHSAAQFNSVWKALSEEDQDALKEEEKKKSKVKRSVAGLADAPSSFRPDSKATKFLNGVANPEARVLGGVLANGSIERTVTINLVALRGLHGGTDKETKQIRKYLLTLALLAAT